MRAQVRESRIVDMVGQLNRARSQGVSAAERSALLDSITAEAGRVRSGREAETTASILGKVGLSSSPPPCRGNPVSAPATAHALRTAVTACSPGLHSSQTTSQEL